MTYHFGDIWEQERILRRQLPNETVAKLAVERMVKRVARYYNLDNKYDGKGEKRDGKGI